MADVHDHEFLSFGDALFLYLEREEAPLNIGAVATFDGSITIQDFTRFVESKLPSIPRYLQKIVFPPLHLGLPWWEFDPTFDIRNHVRAAKLKRGTDSELKGLASKLFSETLDRRHPLWDLTLVPHLKDGKTGLVLRVHHSLADGVSGVGLLNALLDASPEVVPLPRTKLQVPKHTPRDPAASLIDGVLTSFADSVQRILGAHSEVMRMAEKLVKPPSEDNSEAPGLSLNHDLSVPSMDNVGRLMPELLAPTDKLPFNTLCKGPQRFDWTTIPFADLRAIKHECGVTVNDVLLAIVGLAFRHYAKAHGVDVRSRDLRIVVPVSTRDRHSTDQLGNQITFVPVNVPLGISSPQRVIAEVNARTQMIKTAHVPELVAFGGTLMGTIPSPLQAMFSSILSRLPLSLCNIICTNVPGPKTPLYMFGHKMSTCFPHVPIGGEMGVNCAVLTYDGHAFIGFAGDEHAIPDLEKLPAFIDKSFAEMRAAVGLGKPVAKAVSKPGAKSVTMAVPERKPRVRKSRVKANPPTVPVVPPVVPEVTPVAERNGETQQEQPELKRAMAVAV